MKCINIVIILFIVATILLLFNCKREESMNKSIDKSNEEEVIEIHIDDLRSDDLQKYYGKEETRYLC